MNGIDARKAELLAAHRIRWELGINDPSWLGWLTVAGYLLAAGLAWRAGVQATRQGHSVDTRLWRGAGAAMLLLAINKQLDLHVLVTDVGRYLAVLAGWYQQRRGFQAVFIATVMIVLAVAVMVGFAITRNRDPALRLAMGGLAVSAAYILVRAASIHHVDEFVSGTELGKHWAAPFELAGMALVGMGAWRYRAGWPSSRR